MAAALVAARGIFDEVQVSTNDGMETLTCLDALYPRGLNDPVTLVVKRIQSEETAKSISTLINIGPGDVALADIPGLLRLA